MDQVWKDNTGKRHRTDGPAIIRHDGSREWYQHGLLHREDGPAREWADGDISWWQNGQRHRADGPAVEYTEGYKAWYMFGARHRTDGPAVEYREKNPKTGELYEWWHCGFQFKNIDAFLKMPGISIEEKSLLKLRYG